MPGLDRTGPMGQGSRTGRGLGVCSGGTANAGRGLGLGLRRGFGAGRGLGRGLGRGRGLGPANWAAADVSRDDLAARIGELEAELQQLKETNENSDN